MRVLVQLYKERVRDALGFRNTSILHLTDSSSGEAVMRIGSPVPERRENGRGRFGLEIVRLLWLYVQGG
jgi:hypothetical protein